MAGKLNKWDSQHLRDMDAVGRKIDDIFKSAVGEAASIGATVKVADADKIFTFDDYPITKKRVDDMLQGLHEGLQQTIVNGVRAEWTLANRKNDELCNNVFGDNAVKLSKKEYKRYYSTNDAARKAFETRKESGMNISDRVWNYTNGFKAEMELGIDAGLGNGMSAAAMSKELRKYLKNPDKLFRRVRDKHGNLKLSKAAASFHPGRGVYRSSYKNALRLAATETNMAYRTSDHERWQQLDFVVGIRVVLSNNHTLNGQPFTDICDELSAPLGFKPDEKRGLYPKDFKFTGWHPFCRCHAISVLKTPEELAMDNERIMNGEETTNDSVNKVDDVPTEFKEWIKNNEDKISSSTTLPYFLNENKVLIDNMLHSDDIIEDAFSKERKDAAIIPNSAEEADDILRPQAEELWKNATQEQKEAAYRYTKNSYYMNLPLRGSLADIEGNYYDDLKNFTEYIDKSKLEQDMWLVRGESKWGFLGKFDIDLEDIPDKDLKSLVGKEGVEKGFLSCSDNKGHEFADEIKYNVYCPKGTKGLYVEPFSAYGSGAELNWDGKSKQDFFDECEVVIQRGSKLRISKISKTEGIWNIDIEVIGQSF